MCAPGSRCTTRAMNRSKVHVIGRLIRMVWSDAMLSSVYSAMVSISASRIRDQSCCAFAKALLHAPQSAHCGHSLFMLLLLLRIWASTHSKMKTSFGSRLKVDTRHACRDFTSDRHNIAKHGRTRSRPTRRRGQHIVQGARIGPGRLTPRDVEEHVAPRLREVRRPRQ